MMKQLFTFCILFSSVYIFSQDYNWSEKEINFKLDSIKQEGNLLYSLENASWKSTDIVRDDLDLQEMVGDYLTYQKSDTVKTVFLNLDKNQVIAEFSYLNNSKKPVKDSYIDRNLNEMEMKLLSAKKEITSQLSEPKYDISVPEDYSLNIVIIPFGEKYKTYLLTGASKNDVIPFGNDYLFISDKNGKIIDHKKFHSRLIPTFTKDQNGGTVTMSTHSHLKTNPLISATDICTFKLYAPLSNLEKFSVYSPALSTYFEYNMKTDTLKKVKSPL